MTEHVRAMAVSEIRNEDSRNFISLIEMDHNGSRMVYLGDLSDDEYLNLTEYRVKIETHFVFPLPEEMGKLEAGYFLARNHREFVQDYIDHDLENND